MAITKYLARDLKIEIQDPASGSGWIEIKGLNTLAHSPKTTEADTTDFDSGGHAEHLVAERGEEWALDGYKLEDRQTGAYDPGQSLVEALGQEISVTSIGEFRITSPGGNWAIFHASAEVTHAGGAKNDAAKWAAKLSVSGATLYGP